MKRIIGTLVTVGMSGSLLTGCILGTEQPKNPCMITGPDFAARYRLQEGSVQAGGSATQASCTALMGQLKGEMLGGNMYPTLNAAGDLTGLTLGLEPEGALYTYGRAGELPVVTAVETYGDANAQNRVDNQAFLSAFTTFESWTADMVGTGAMPGVLDSDDNNLCAVPTMAKISGTIPAPVGPIPVATEDKYLLTDDTEGALKVQSPKDPKKLILNPKLAWKSYGHDAAVSYTFENVNVYSTASVPGTMFNGSVTVTHERNGESCTAKYALTAVHPVVSCVGAEDPVLTNGVYANADLDPSACKAEPAPGAQFGSGINADLKVCCSRSVGLCVLADADILKAQGRTPNSDISICD